MACPGQSEGLRHGAGGWQDADVGYHAAGDSESGKITENDYDFTKPNIVHRTLTHSSRKGEYYDYPGKYRSKRRWQPVCASPARGAGSQLFHSARRPIARALSAVFKFTLSGLLSGGRQPGLLAARRAPSGASNTYISHELQEAFDYRNSIEAIPNPSPYHPPRNARRPFIQGSQTAVVVGKSGEEIWVDQYGRVKVQFFWDRAGNMDENSSCWIRVAQLWAGKGWGAIFTPRIGQEVIVDFLEGDPDRPIITGRVYNGDQTVPYALPGEQTKSTIKSMSSKGGGGFNEIRLEDKKGSEQVFILGQKNQDIRIKNDVKEWVGEDRNLMWFATRRKKSTAIDTNT